MSIQRRTQADDSLCQRQHHSHRRTEPVWLLCTRSPMGSQDLLDFLLFGRLHAYDAVPLLTVACSKRHGLPSHQALLALFRSCL